MTLYIELIQQTNIVTRYDHEHDSLLMSNPFYEQLTKTVRRQLELYIFLILCLYVYGHIHMFHALQSNLVPVHKKA